MLKSHSRITGDRRAISGIRRQPVGNRGRLTCRLLLFYPVSFDRTSTTS